MKDRLIAFLLVCMMVLFACSPAFAASTTESQIMMAVDDDGIAPFVLGDSDNPIICTCQVELFNSDLQDSVYSFNSFALGTFPNSLAYTSNISHQQFAFPDDLLSYDFDQVRVTYSFRLQDNSWFTNIPMNIRFGRLFFATWNNDEPGDRLFSMSGLKKIVYQIQRGTSFSNSYFTSESILSGAVSGSSPSFMNSDVIFSSQIPFETSIVGSTFYYDYGFQISFYFDKSSIDFNADEFRVGFGYYLLPGSSIPNANFFSYKAAGAISSSQQNQATQDAINQTTSAVQQVNSSIQSLSSAMSSAFSDLSAQMGQISLAINSAMQTMTQQLQQQTEAINNMVTQQVQQIRQDLGLVNDNLLSGFSSVTTSITNQTTQITGKIDSLQQSVENKLDTVNQSVTEGFDNTVEELETANKTLDEMPDKIGNKLLELFVPSAEDMEAYYDKFSELMESKLGFVWQVIDDILIGLFTTLINGFTNPQTTITIPALTLPGLGQIWAEMTFNIIPEGMEFVTEYTKLLTNLVFLLLVINRIVDFRNTFFEYYDAAAPVGEQIAAEYWAEQDARTAARIYNQRRASFAKARGRR